jgi:RND family efflux transporter MFP subunit
MAVLNRQLILCITALLLTSACNKEPAGGKPKAEDIISVETATAQPSNLTRNINAIGSIRHTQETPVSFAASGRVTALRYDVGDYIRQGALIASLSTENVQMVAGGSAGGGSDAENAAAYARLAKMEDLYRDGWVTKKQFESAQAKADMARARAQAPVTTIKRGSAALYSPAGGVVLARLAEAGQTVGPGSPAYVLGQDNLGFTFRAPVTGADAAMLKVGMAANITIETVTGGPLQSTISKIEEQTGGGNGPVMVQFRMPPAKGIKSGQIATVSIPVDNADEGFLIIPATALLGIRGKDASVYIVSPAVRRIETRKVMIDRLADGYAIVSGGITAGDTVVVSGKERLKIGTHVSIKR